MGDTCTIHTSATAAEAFATVADLAGYASWLARSASYRGTDVESATLSHLRGMRYTDRTPLGRVEGVVVDVEMDRRIQFRQALRDQSLRIDITYSFEPDATGTVVRRTGIVQVRGRLRPIAWVVIALTRAENRRTMRGLRRHLDRLSRINQAAASQ